MLNGTPIGNSSRERWTLVQRLIWLKATVLAASGAIWHTVTGAIVSFIAPKAHSLKQLMVTLEPQQGLHGYDAPWPEGGGKNKFDQDTVYATYKDADNSFSGSSYDIEQIVTNIPAELVGKELTWSAFIDLSGISNPTNFKVKVSVGGTVTNGNNVTAGNTGYSSVTFTPTSTSDFIGLTHGSGTGTIKLKDFQLEVSSSRTTWTPFSNICPISGWTGCEVTVANENIFDTDHLEQFTITSENIFNGHTYAKPGTYAIKTYATGESNFLYARIRNADGTFSSIYYIVAGTSVNNYVITVAAGQTLVIYHAVSGRTPEESKAVFDAWKLLVAYGEDYPDAFIPYTGNSYSVTWEDETGTVYGGTVDLLSGVLTVEWKGVDMGNLPWQYITASNRNYFYVGFSDKTTLASDLICSIYPYGGSKLDSQMGSADDFTIYSETGYGAVKVKDSRYTDGNTLKTALTGQKLLYELATPLTYQLTSTEVTALLGVNNVWADTGDVTVTFRGTPIVEPDAEPLQALNLLLGGAYRNDQTPEDVPDDEALDILLGGADR